VDHLAAAKHARDCVWVVRNGTAFHYQAAAFQDKNGSRKRVFPNRGQRGKKAEPQRISLHFEG